LDTYFVSNDAESALRVYGVPGVLQFRLAAHGQIDEQSRAAGTLGPQCDLVNARCLLNDRSDLARAMTTLENDLGDFNVD
jgi:hypothetical protein